MTDSINGEEVELKETWASFTKSRDPNQLILAGGVNLRFNVAKALKTVFLSAKIYFRTKAAPLTMDPWTVLGIGKDVYDLVVAGLDTLRQSLNKSVYTLAVVLSKVDGPISEEDLQKAVQDFVGAGRDIELPWYLGISEAHIKETAATLAGPQGFRTLLGALQKEGLAEIVDGKWCFKPLHFTWSGKID